MPRFRVRTLCALVAVLALTAAACDSDGNGEGDGSEPAESTTTTTAAALPDPIADQTPPVGTNGIADPGDGTFWIADLNGSQVLRVDASSGAILARYGAAEGVNSPDDVAVADDGSVYYTGLGAGEVGRIDPDGTVEVVAEVPVGVNPIAFTDDGRLFVGLEKDAPEDAVYEIDITGDTEPRLVGSDLGRVNAFAFGPDGLLYGPGFGLDGAGTLRRIDVETGESTVVTDGFGFPVSVRFGDDGTAYVLQTAQPTLWSVDIETGEKTEVGTPTTELVDNFTLTDDGFAVTAFNAPTVTLMSSDGSVTGTLTIGTPT
ncbi:MAG: hypothetical protein R3A49_09715 [Acidimicrobiia bacterium]